jgi:uncharacterized protein (DUF1501 family)
MKHEITVQTRREFLRTTLAGGALTWTVPAFLANTFSALNTDAENNPDKTPKGLDSRILVVLQMAGGNDGLNTVVPWNDDYYHRARPRLGLSRDRVLKLNDDLGFHPNLGGLKSLYDAGSVSIIQAVGYPNPNRSHFRSTEIWQTASSADKAESTGWLGRFFDNDCSGCDPTVGISIGRQTPQAFAAREPRGISLENPNNYRFLSPEKSRRGEMSSAEESFRKLNQEENDIGENSGGSVSAIHGAAHHAGSALDYPERTAMDAQISSDKIRSLADKVQTSGDYPASQLGNSLKLVTKLIGGGLATRVFYVSQGGYDTHTNQVGTHERLLKDLGDSLKAFVDDLKAQGNMERVVIMTFSEFGRRVAENASGGTDHGAAAPIFVVGSKVKAGLLGKAPSLAPADLFQGDLKYHVDFRAVYSTVLERWLNVKSEPILGGRFAPLDLV